MTNPPPPDAGPPPGARRHCPRCGAPMGVLDAGAGGTGGGRGPEAPARATPEALYCGCCGLVVAAR